MYETKARAMWGLWFLLWISFVFTQQEQFDGPTPVSRLDLLHAITIGGTFAIDAYHKNTPDKALFEKHYYSDKAPGTVALALASFAATADVLRLVGVNPESRTGWLVSSWGACAASNGIIASLGGAALFEWLSRYVATRWALLT